MGSAQQVRPACAPHCVSWADSGSAPEDLRPRRLVPVAGKTCWLSVLLHGAARASSEHGGWVPKSMSQETGRRNGRFLKGLAWTLAHLSLPHAIGQAVPESSFLGKGQRPYFLMRAGSDLRGAVCKPQELVLQKGSILPFHRPSLRADVLHRSPWCVQG